MNAPVRLPLPPSLYADTAVAPVSTTPLDADRNVPVAIIGGGFTGLSTALHLAEQGVQATVLEAQEPGWGASGNNGGHVNPGLKHDPDQIQREVGGAVGEVDHAAAELGTEIGFDLIRVVLEAGIDLAAIIAGGAPAGLLRFQHGCLHALLGQMQRGR